MALGFPYCAVGLSATAASSNRLQAGVKLLRLGAGWGLSSGLAGEPRLTHWEGGWKSKRASMLQMLTDMRGWVQGSGQW